MSQFSAVDPGFVLMLMAFALFGALLGGAHFASLHRTVRVLLHERRLAPAIALPLLRLGFTGAGLGLAALHGAGSLLICLVGFLAARAMALRIAGSAP